MTFRLYSVSGLSYCFCAKPCYAKTTARLLKIRTSLHYPGQLEVLIWHLLNMFGVFSGETSDAIMMLEHVLKLSLRFVVNGQRSPRMASESLLVRCVAGTLPVCGLTEVIPLIKHSVTFENDPTLFLYMLLKVYWI